MANSESRITRRELIAGGGLFAAGAVLGLGAAEYRNKEKSSPYYEYDEYIGKFPRISQERSNRFSSSVEIEKSSLAHDSHENELKAMFTADPTHLYGLEVNGLIDPTISLQTVRISVGEKKFLAPIIQSKKSSTSSLYIGEMEGEQEITVASIEKDTAPLVNLQLLRIDADSFAREAIRNIPNLHIREDNVDNPTNDVPLNSNIFFRENWLGVRMAEYWMRYSGESNKHVPYPLVDETGRIWDYDVMSLIKMTKDGNKLEEARMGKSHYIYIVGQSPTPELLPWGERSEYQSIESNNMVSEDIKTDISCSYLCDEYRNLSSEASFDREIALKVLSIREYINEGSLGKGDPYVEWVIANDLDGVDLIYPYLDVDET